MMYIKSNTHRESQLQQQKMSNHHRELLLLSTAKRTVVSASSSSSPSFAVTTTVIDVMGDFTSIRTLIAVSRCSKRANKTITILVRRKTENAQEMRQLVLDIFPTIKDLPAIAEADQAMQRLLAQMHGCGSGGELLLRIISSASSTDLPFPAIGNVHAAAAYYCVLLVTYFMGKSRPLVVVSHLVGVLLDLRTREPAHDEIVSILKDEMRSSSGRRSILKAIHDWRRAGPNHSFPWRLNAIADIIRGDFAIVQNSRVEHASRRDVIGSVHG
jgi:hypothetical protein